MALTLTDVSGEAVLLAGGAAAILLQVADPAVARGVAAQSNFADRPLDRLHGTLTYLYVTAFGTPEEAREVARAVGGVHRPVPGATDAQLQLWVAATLYATAMRVRELVFGVDDPAEADALLAEYAVVGTALGLPRSAWPADRASFDSYWAGRELNVGDDARAIAAALLHPARPRWLRALMPTIRVVTAGLLDADLREAYGLEFDARRFDRLVARTRAIYPKLPARLRRWPARYYLTRYRRRRRT